MELEYIIIAAIMGTVIFFASRSVIRIWRGQAGGGCGECAGCSGCKLRDDNADRGPEH